MTQLQRMVARGGLKRTNYVPSLKQESSLYTVSTRARTPGPDPI